MNYCLINSEQLEQKGLFPYAERLPDGRAIIAMNSLKAASGFKDVDIVDERELRELKKRLTEEVDPIEPGEQDQTEGEDNPEEQDPNKELPPEDDLEQETDPDPEEITPKEEYPEEENNLPTSGKRRNKNKETVNPEEDAESE